MINAKKAKEMTAEANMPIAIDGITFDELCEMQNKLILDAVSRGKWNTKYLFSDDKYWGWSDKANDYYLRKGLGYHVFRCNGVEYIAW